MPDPQRDRLDALAFGADHQPLEVVAGVGLGRLLAGEGGEAVVEFDQLLGGATVTLREIKSVTRALPADEAELRADYPGYFVQLATYLALWRITPPELPGAAAAAPAALRGDLVFVEAGSGLAQTVPLTPADDALFRTQLERVTEDPEGPLRVRVRLS